MVLCLAKHSGDTVKYEMEMMRRGSKRTVKDANLAQQDADRSDDMPCKSKKIERIFGGNLPSPATNPGVGNSRPLCETAQGVAQAEPSHPCSCTCVGALSCQHQIERTYCHRCWFCKLEGGHAPGGYVTRDETKFGDFMPVSCWESSIADAHRDPCL